MQLTQLDPGQQPDSNQGLRFAQTASPSLETGAGQPLVFLNAIEAMAHSVRNHGVSIAMLVHWRVHGDINL